MKTAVKAFGIFLSVIFILSCGGGGGSSPTPPAEQTLSPTITTTPPPIATVNTQYSYSAISTDPGGSGLRWSIGASDTCPNSTINTGTGVYSFTTTRAGWCKLAIHVCDGGVPNLCTTQSSNIIFDTSGVNDGPIITTSSPATAAVGVQYNYSPVSIDPDGPGATWSIGLLDDCPGSTINSTSGAYTFTPTTTGYCKMEIKICDGGSPISCVYEDEDLVLVATPPLAPSNLNAATASSTQIRLTWTNNAGYNKDGFKIERKTGAESYSQIATVVTVGVTSYFDTGLTPGTTYYYKVVAYNAMGDSTDSNEAGATTQAAPTSPPTAPANLSVASTPPCGPSALSCSGYSWLTWTDNSINEEGFIVEQKPSGGLYVAWGPEMPPDSQSSKNIYTWRQPEVGPGTHTDYCPSRPCSYRVYSFNSAGYSAYSNEVSY
jgi:hypothetical protein